MSTGVKRSVMGAMTSGGREERHADAKEGFGSGSSSKCEKMDCIAS
jgi:hypothetical protein